MTYIYIIYIIYIIYNIYIYTFFCLTTPTNIPPRRPRRILDARGETVLCLEALQRQAAVVEQLISAGAAVDAADAFGHGPGRVFELFWEWLWRGDGRGLYIGSWIVALLWDFGWSFLFKDPLLCWDGPLESRGGTRNEVKWVEGRRNHVVSKCSLIFCFFQYDFGLDPASVLEIASPYGTYAVKYFHCQR